MLKINSTNINFSGASYDANDVFLASFNANYNGGTEVYFNMTLNFVEVSDVQNETINADFAEFKNEIIEMVNAARTDLPAVIPAVV